MSRALADREQLISSNDAAFLLSALKGVDTPGGQRVSLRLDGRTPRDQRTISITLLGGGATGGTVQVALGQTRAIASVTGEIVTPNPNRPTEVTQPPTQTETLVGFLNFSVSLSPLSSPFIDSLRPSDRSIEIVRILERAIRESRALDTEALCVVAGEKVWNIRCDVIILDHAGNLTDAAVLAGLVALMVYRRADVTVVGDKVVIHSVNDRQSVPLSLHHLPVSVTFAFFEGGSLSVVDPSLMEEGLAEASMTIVINQYHQVCCVHKSGGAPITEAQLLTCINIADSKASQLIEYVQERVKEETNTGTSTSSMQAPKTRKNNAEVSDTQSKSDLSTPAVAFGATLSTTVTPVPVDKEVRSDNSLPTIDLTTVRSEETQMNDEQETNHQAAERQSRDRNTRQLTTPAAPSPPPPKSASVNNRPNQPPSSHPVTASAGQSKRKGKKR